MSGYVSSSSSSDASIDEASRLLSDLLEAGEQAHRDGDIRDERGRALTQSGEKILARRLSSSSRRVRLRPISRSKGGSSARNIAVQSGEPNGPATEGSASAAVSQSNRTLIVQRRRLDASTFWKAVEQGDWEWVETYLDRGVATQRSVHPSNGRRPIHIASMLGHADLVRGLLERGDLPDASIRTINGSETPLHLAAAGDHADIAELLIASGASCNAKNGIGYTPLHYVCGKNGVRIAKMLLEAGTDQSIKCNRGFTALQLSRERGCEDVALVLKDERINRFQKEQTARKDHAAELARRRKVNAASRRKAELDKFKAKMKAEYENWRQCKPPGPRRSR